jgi:hypothetical protein
MMRHLHFRLPVMMTRMSGGRDRNERHRGRKQGSQKPKRKANDQTTQASSPDCKGPYEKGQLRRKDDSQRSTSRWASKCCPDLAIKMLMQIIGREIAAG